MYWMATVHKSRISVLVQCQIPRNHIFPKSSAKVIIFCSVQFIQPSLYLLSKVLYNFAKNANRHCDLYAEDTPAWKVIL